MWSSDSGPATRKTPPPTPLVAELDAIVLWRRRERGEPRHQTSTGRLHCPSLELPLIVLFATVTLPAPRTNTAPPMPEALLR